MTSIFSDQINKKLERISDKIKADSNFLITIMLIGLTGFTILLAFWWGMLGEHAKNAYIAYWYTTYPATPISESFGWQYFQFVDTATLIFLIAAWTIMICYLVFISTGKKQSKKQDTIIIPNGAGGWDEHNIHNKPISYNQFTYEQVIANITKLCAYTQTDIDALCNNLTLDQVNKLNLCKYCNSTKVRPSLNKEKGNIYCKFCRKFS